MARPFSSDAAGDGICGRKSSSRRRDLFSEVIPQVCEQARERSRTQVKEGRAGTVTGRIVIDFHLGFVKVP